MNIFNEIKLLKYIDNYKTELTDRKKSGSVFTNSKTINNMLDKLPIGVWTNPKFKWFDPGCGIGNFHIIIFFRLMKSLPIQSEEKRRKHIIENMLYFAEINYEYINILKKIFCSDKYKINIFHGSYVYLNALDKNIPIFNHDIFNTYFDIVVFNPPFQKPNSKDNNKLSSKPLYPFFVEESFKYLKDNGYLLCIHPVSWRRKSKEIKLINHILNKHLLYIYTNNDFHCFGISAPYINYYLIKNVEYNKDNLTEYETYFNNKYYKGNIHLKNTLEFIPLLLTNETMSIFEKVLNKLGDKLDVQLESKFSTTKKNISVQKTNEYIYLNSHSLSMKNGRIFRYSKVKHPSHDKLKILMNFHGGYRYLDPFIDCGTMGITDSSMRMYVNNDNKNLLLDFLKSDLFKFLLMATTYNYGANQKNEFHIINLFTKPSISDFYKFYSIKKKEQLFIEKNLI